MTMGLKLPRRDPYGHKGTFGRLLIVGGQPEMTGAPALTGLAALRSGVGLVQVACSENILASILTIAPELIGLSLSAKGEKKLVLAAQKSDAIVIGPGWSESKYSAKLLSHLLMIDQVRVLDAGALNILSQQKAWPQKARGLSVLTPHPGEMKRLAHWLGRTEVPNSQAGRKEIAKALAQLTGQIVLLKGPGTIVTNGHETYVNTSGDNSLAKAGTGDVLSGILGAFLAQRIEPFKAACLAAFVHGTAGELAGKKHGQRSVIASDVIAELCNAFKK